MTYNFEKVNHANCQSDGVWSLRNIILINIIIIIIIIPVFGTLQIQSQNDFHFGIFFLMNFRESVRLDLNFVIRSHINYYIIDILYIVQAQGQLFQQ